MSIVPLKTATITVREVRSCARCQGNHGPLEFRPLTHRAKEFTHWCPCPTNAEPILLRLVELAVDPDEMPFVCPGCHAVGAEPCVPGCVDAELAERVERCRECGRLDYDCGCPQSRDDLDANGEVP